MSNEDIDLASELVDSEVVSVHLLTSDQSVQLMKILDVDDSIDMVLTFKKKGAD